MAPPTIRSYGIGDVCPAEFLGQGRHQRDNRGAGDHEGPANTHGNQIVDALRGHALAEGDALRLQQGNRPHGISLSAGHYARWSPWGYIS